MPAFLKNLLKDPKFDAAAIIVLWVLYIVGENFKLEPVEFHLIPFWRPLSIPVSEIVIGAAVFGCLATIVVQRAWRRRGSSKPASESGTGPVSNRTPA